MWNSKIIRQTSIWIIPIIEKEMCAHSPSLVIIRFDAFEVSSSIAKQGSTVDVIKARISSFFRLPALEKPA